MVEHVSKEDLRLAYELSVNAYQSHVQRYGTWMNMYAIMTGALFIAFYSIYGDEVKGMSDSKDVFLILISVLGFVCSLCWLGAVKGHYEWMKSFMRIVKLNERRYFGFHNTNAPFVYSKVMVSEDVCSKSGNYLYGFFSTQKITLFFISLVMLGWVDILLFFFLQYQIRIYWCVVVGLLLLHIIVYFGLYYYGCKPIRDLLGYFYSTIRTEKEVIKIKI